jgi:hypothetical protein
MKDVRPFFVPVIAVIIRSLCASAIRHLTNYYLDDATWPVKRIDTECNCLVSDLLLLILNVKPTVFETPEKV